MPPVLASIGFPKPRRGEFHEVAIRIPEVQAPRSALPSYVAEDLNTVVLKPCPPCTEPAPGDGEGNVPGPWPLAPRHSARRNHATGSLAWRPRGLVSYKEKKLTVGHAEHAAPLTGLDLPQT